jgi:hypothetical protein
MGEQAPNVSLQIDRELAKQAVLKRQKGEQPTREELAALRRFEEAREEERRWEYYRGIPQKHWREMSGRQTKVLNEQAARYGIPFGGATINLPAVVRALHDFLARNARRLAAPDNEDPDLAGGTSINLERLRREKAELARMDREEREGLLLPRAPVHDAHQQMAMILRRCGETLQRLHGPDAARVLTEGLDDCDRIVAALFGDDAADEPRGPTAEIVDPRADAPSESHEAEPENPPSAA